MVYVFYRSVSDGWRVGVVDSIAGEKVVVRDGAVEETISSLDIYTPEARGGAEGEDAQQLLFHMADNPSVFLQKRDAALMFPSPLVGLPPFIELLRQRSTNGELCTNIGDNFSLLLGEGSPLDVQPLGYDMALKAALVWKGSGRRQVVVSCGHTQPTLCSNFVSTCCSFLEATPAQLKVIKAGMDVISALTCTVGRRQMCYLQAHLYAEEGQDGKLKGVHVECNHSFTAGIGNANDFNFKIFSYMLYGFSMEEREQFFINRKQQDFMCQSNIEDMSLVARLREEYYKFIEMTETLGLTFATRLSLFRRVAAIVHLTEIEFYNDGSISNLPALKNAAHLLQLDVQVCLRIFTSREVCVAAARLLYTVTLALVLKEVNNAMNFSGEMILQPQAASVSMLVIPPLPSPASDDVENIVIASVYEDLIQAFLRSSEQEVLQWQRAGLCVPGRLQQAMLDALDNYSLLKVLYGLGGLLSIAEAAQGSGETELALKSCAKHSRVRFNTSTLVLTVEHSFGERHYQFPRDDEHLVRLKTVNHSDYKAMRTLLMEEADLETREALHLMLQGKAETLKQAVAQESFGVKPLLDVLRDETNLFWWIGSIDLGADYRGDYVEMQLKEIPLLCAMQLRGYFPSHYVRCRHEFIISSFKSLLPSSAVATHNTSASASTYELAGRVLEHCGVKYCETHDGVLLGSAALMELHFKAREQICQQVTLVQVFARARFCTYTCWRRVGSWTEAIEKMEQQQKRALDRYRQHYETAGMHHSKLLDLMEEENAARSSIREKCWSERAELQQAAQEKLEGLLVQMVAVSIRKGEESMRSAMQSEEAGKLQMIHDYIRTRAEKHRAHLDGIVEEHLCSSRSRSRSQRIIKAQQNLLRGRELSRGRRMQLEDALDRKRSKSETSRMEYKQQSQAKSEMARLRCHRNQAARKQILQAREDFNETLGVQTMLLDMEARIARQVKNEVLSFRRQENERLAQKLREERQRQEDADIRREKAIARKKALQGMRAEQAKEAERRRKRHEAQVQLDLQERQRRAMERIEAAKDRRQKGLIHAVFRAQSELSRPRLYEHRASQTSIRTSVLDRHLGSPIPLPGGGTTYTRMLSESSLRGLLNYHATKTRKKSPYPFATPMR